MTDVKTKKSSLAILTLMASITFMAILAELMPSGVLPDMANYFNISKGTAGGLIGAYAIASAFLGIPLVSITISWNRKLLLEILLIGFACANLIVGLAPNFTLALIGRAIGGACAGTMWPMITAYAMELVSKEEAGKAITIVMSGITVGMALGVPAMTLIGTIYGFHLEFLALVVGLVLIAILCHLYLPSVQGEKASKSNSPFTMFKNKGVLWMLGLTFLGVGANYGVYTFITNLVSDSQYPSVTTAQFFFGIGSVISVLLVMCFIDRYMYGIMLAVFAVGACTMLLFVFNHAQILFHIAFILWGLGFGSLSSLFQTATAKQVKEGAAVANSLQSSSFNFAIMFGSTGAGILLGQAGTRAMLLASCGLLVLGVFLTYLCKKKL